MQDALIVSIDVDEFEDEGNEFIVFIQKFQTKTAFHFGLKQFTKL